MRSTLIVGIGNVLRGDDGAGPAVVARLALRAAQATTACFTTQQLMPEMAERLAGVTLVVFVDAAVDVAPGEVKTERLHATSRHIAPPVGHFVEPQGLLALAKTAYAAEPDAWLVAIGGESFGYEERLSGAAERGVDAAVAEVERLVKA